MVIATPLLASILALPTGLLFGVGYGNGVRIGYEQIYPLLFPSDKSEDGKKLRKRGVSSVVSNMASINKIYDALGGKEANIMGMAVGLNAAMKDIEASPDFQDLLQLEFELSGNTPSNYLRSRYGLDNISTISLDEIEQAKIDSADLPEKSQKLLDQLAHDAEKQSFRESMENLSDEKLKDFFRRRNQIYNKDWKIQIITLVHKLRFGNEESEKEDKKDKPLNLDEEVRAVVIFSYPSTITGKIKQVKVTYKGNYRWHKHKLLQIRNAVKQNRGLAKAEMYKLFNAYYNKLNFTFAKPFHIEFNYND